MRRRCTLYSDRVPAPEEFPGSGPVSVDEVLVDQALLGIRGGPIQAPGWAAIAWTDPDDPSPGGDRSWLVDTFVAWSGVGPPAVKQVSLVVRLEGLDADLFVSRYRNHATIAQVHHGMDRYVQNSVAEGPPGLDAVSELCFASEQSWIDDFYLLADSAGVLREDVRAFIDLRATASALVAEHVIRPCTGDDAARVVG